MNKEAIINSICNSLSDYLNNIGYKNIVVKNIYHEIINDIFCTQYNVQAPVATYEKNGPHIYININSKNGFGFYSSEVSFNKSLYDDAKYWSELLLPDFIMIFSENIKDVDFTNYLFEENKNIILNGFKSKDGKMQKIPIYIVELNKYYNDIRIAYYNVDFNNFIGSNDNLLLKKINKIEKFTINDAYIAGNVYGRSDAVNYENNTVTLRFNNFELINSKLSGSKIKLKFFNKIRDLERRFKNEYGKVILNLGLDQKNDTFKVENIYLTIYCKKRKNSFLKRIHLIDLKSYPPIYAKSFLRGFIDNNYVSLSEDYYDGFAGIAKKNITSDISYIFQTLGVNTSLDTIKISQDLLEVRREPFVKDEIVLF